MAWKGMARLQKKYADRLPPNAIDKDQDGYWVYPRWGWYNGSPGSHLIHEYSLKDVEAVLKTLERGCECGECLAGIAKGEEG